MPSVVDTGIVGNDVVLVAAISQTTDAVPTISVKSAFADNGVADVHTEIEPITTVIASDVVRPKTMLDGRAGVKTVSQTAFGEAITDNRSSPSLNAYAVREPVVYDASPHAGIYRPHQMYGRHGKVDKNVLTDCVASINAERFQFTALLLPPHECRESVSNHTIPVWETGRLIGRSR